MNKVAAGTIRTKTYGMIGSAQICLVFGMSGHCTQFGHAMCKLALFAIFASTVFGERPAKFGLVAAGVNLGGRAGAGGGGGGGGGVAVVSIVDFVSQTL